MNTLQEIRNAIQAESENKLSVAGMINTLDAICEFKEEYHYIPQDIDDWYESTLSWMNEQLNALEDTENQNIQ